MARYRCSTNKDRLSAHRAFTLIELLVVVSIIALLISILLPALGNAKKKAASVVCLSRLSGLGKGMATYLAEWDNTFPINGVLFPKGDINDITTLPDMYQTPLPNRFSNARALGTQYWRLEYGGLWQNMGGIVPNTTVTPPLPLPSATTAKMYICPSDSLNRTFTGTGSTIPLTEQVAAGKATVVQGPGSPGYWSYSVNSVLNSLGRFRNKFPDGLPWADPLKATNIQNPSNFLYFIEEGEDSLMNDEVFDAPAFGGGDHLTNRHNNGGNLGFGDGHAETVSEVAFDNGGQNPTTTDAYTAMQSPWTRFFFPDNGQFATPP